MMSQSIVICGICEKADNDPIEFGDFMVKGQITVHYYCLLLSTHLPQRGKDDSGILGFLINDIKTEITASTKRVCPYCNKKGASVKCHKCDMYFHQICGNANNCVFEFFDEFKSYCHQHYELTYPIIHEPNEGCIICNTAIGEYNPVTSIAGRCCSLGWAHRKCIRHFALSAGYYLRCIWCKKPEFRDLIRCQGVFVPDRDAYWEQDKAFFDGLYKSCSNCDALECKCPRGKTHKSKTGKWLLHLCVGCGASGIHEACWDRNTSEESYKCETCINILNRTRNSSAVDDSIAPGTLDVTLFMAKTFTESADQILTFKEAPESKSNESNLVLCSKRSVEFHVWNSNKEIIGFATGYLKDSSKYDDDFLSHDDVELTELFDHDPLLDKIAQEYIERQALKPNTVIEVQNSDEEQAKCVDDIIQEMMNTENVDMPKPLK